MMKDWGSWDSSFQDVTAAVRKELLEIAGNKNNQYGCVPLQGSGTYIVEAMLASFLPKGRKPLILSNGAYGQRCAKIMTALDRPFAILDTGDYLPPSPEEVRTILRKDKSITDVVIIHCETSSGILNPLEEIAEVTASEGRTLLIDAMSTFGAIDIDPKKTQHKALVSSANKCLEGVPGMGFLIGTEEALHACKGNSHSLSLDIHDQWSHMNKTRQWRFTPPTHVVAAFLEAIQIHKKEGGIEGRNARYSRNRDVLVAGMNELGFVTLLRQRWLSPIIVSFLNPEDKNFDFKTFYTLLKERGFIIYPGKLTVVDSFRIGCIGCFDHKIMQNVVEAVKSVMDEMGITDPSPPKAALEERQKLF
jgi:2-aminoethylphosphonate-pyruvate transaminase